MFVLPQLNYSYSSLEPFIDARTMEIHYTKHHQTYIDNLNKALVETPYAEWSLEKLLAELETLPENLRLVVRNNAGGHANHSFFWALLKKDTEPTKALDELCEQKSGKSRAVLLAELKQSALNRFGSGWAWWVLNSKGEIEVYSTPNQDSPLTKGHKPLLGIDVWEHAYYLHYQNRRADYIDAFFQVINWDFVFTHLVEK